MIRVVFTNIRISNWDQQTGIGDVVPAPKGAVDPSGMRATKDISSGSERRHQNLP